MGKFTKDLEKVMKKDPQTDLAINRFFAKISNAWRKSIKKEAGKTRVSGTTIHKSE
jgi:hypothetical protein